MSSTKSLWGSILIQLERYQADLDLDVEAMDVAVARMGFSAWEVGPYLDTDMVLFSLSPGWDPDKLARSTEIIKTAPVIEGLVFTEAKPPKDWDREFCLQTDAGPVDVDCRKIGFGAARLADETLELSVRLEARLEPWKWDVVNIWIDSEIGERNKILKVVDCEIQTFDQLKETEWGLRDLFFRIFPDAPFAEDVKRMRLRDERES